MGTLTRHPEQITWTNALQKYMCIQWTRVVITVQSNPPISQFNSPCNEFTSQCLYTLLTYQTGHETEDV